MIFTSNAGSASFALPQARAGAWPAGTQASHTAFIASKSAMSVSVYFSLTEIGVQFVPGGDDRLAPIGNVAISLLKDT